MSEAGSESAEARPQADADSDGPSNDEKRLFVEKARSDLLASVDGVVQRLRGPTLSAEDVHRARRLLKRANALALLLSDVVGPRAERGAHDLRRFRRELGASRDLDVMGQTIDSLSPDLDAKLVQELRGALEARRRRRPTEDPALDLPALRRELRWLAGEAARWSLGHGRSDDDLAAALTHSYRRARRRGEEAFATLETPDLHDLRKAVIVHREQLHALADVWPRLVRAWCAEAQALRDALGRVNDLALFAAFLESVGAEAAAAAAPALEGARRHALERAEPGFRRLFFERPSEAERRISTWLSNPKRRPEPPEDDDAEADSA